MSKHKTIQVSALALSLAFTSTLSMSNVLANTNTESLKQISTKSTYDKVEGTQNNEEVFYLLSLVKPEQFTQYDYEQISDAEAKELETFVKEEILAKAGVSLTDRDEKKARTIFQWIGKNIKYASGNEIPQLRPAEIMKTKIAVCGGFSNLYKAMLNTVSIAAVYVNGPSAYGAHQWNVIYLDGAWYFSDATWKAEEDFKQTVEECSLKKGATSIHGFAMDTGKGTTIGFENGEISVIGVDPTLKEVSVPYTVGQGQNKRHVKGFAISAYHDELQRIHFHDQVSFIDTSGSADKLEEMNVDANNTHYASKDGVLYTKDFSQILRYPNAKAATSFTILKETTSFDEKETFKTDRLLNLHVEQNNPKYSSLDGVVYNKAMTKVVTVPNGKTKVVLPSTAIDVNTALQAKPNLTYVEFSEGHKTVGFEYLKNTNVKALVLASTIETIADDVFGYDANGMKQPPKDMIVYGSNEVAKAYANKYNLTYVALNEIEPVRNALGALLVEVDQELAKLNVYTPSTYEALLQARTQANSVLENKLSTKQQVLDSIAALTSAKEALVLQGDVSRIEQLVNEYEKLDASAYQKEAWNTFISQVHLAKQIIAKGKEASVKEVNDALSLLQHAKQELDQHKVVTPQEETPTPNLEQTPNGDHESTNPQDQQGSNGQMDSQQAPNEQNNTKPQSPLHPNKDETNTSDVTSLGSLLSTLSLSSVGVYFGLKLRKK